MHRTPLGEALAGTACDVRSRCWLLTHNVYYRIFFRACLHEQSQKMRSEPIMPHYVNVASVSFFWRGFLFCVSAAALLFFSLPFKKNKCAALRWLTKTMTRKTDCNTGHRPVFWRCKPCCGVGFIRIFITLRLRSERMIFCYVVLQFINVIRFVLLC